MAHRTTWLRSDLPDFQPCPPRACTALSIAIGTAGRFASGSPTADLACRGINALQRAATRSRSEPVARNGLSLACNSAGFSPAPFQGQRSRPAASLPDLSVHDPFGFTLHSRLRFAPAAGSFNAFSPLPFPEPARFAALPASTPLWDVSVPSDQSVLPFRCEPTRLPSPPDLRSLPAAAEIYR